MNLQNKHLELEAWSNSAPVSANLFERATDQQANQHKKMQQLPVDVFSVVTPNTPNFLDYCISDEMLYDLWVWLQGDTPLYLYGPTGCGKSSGITFLASLMRIPLFNLIGQYHTEVQDFYGSRTAVNGTVGFEYGPLTLAYKFGGWFLLDEIDGLNPSLALGLNTVLDGRPIVLENGEVVHRHPRFRFIATANTNGMGSDENGVYQGTNRMNLAFLDRFFVMEASYPQPEVEKSILDVFCPTTTYIHDTMIQFANSVRRNFMGIEEGETTNTNPHGVQYDVTFSTRSLIKWASLIPFYAEFPGKESAIVLALKRSLANIASPECKEALLQSCDLFFPSDMDWDEAVDSDTSEYNENQNY